MRWFVAGLVALVLAGTLTVMMALYREEARREAWWRETKSSCRLLTVVSRTFRPPEAIYECPGGVLVKRNIGD